MLLYSTIRLVVDDLPATGRKMIWLVLAETSTGPAVLDDAEFNGLAPLIRQLLRTLGMNHDPSPLNLQMYLIELVELRGLRVSGNSEAQGAFQVELAEREADELASILEGLAVLLREATPDNEDGASPN